MGQEDALWLALRFCPKETAGGVRGPRVCLSAVSTEHPGESGVRGDGRRGWRWSQGSGAVGQDQKHGTGGFPGMMKVGRRVSKKSPLASKVGEMRTEQ